MTDHDSHLISQAERMARIEANLEHQGRTLESLAKTLKELVDKQDNRITRLEQWRSYVLGLSAAISVIVPTALKKLGIL